MLQMIQNGLKKTVQSLSKLQSIQHPCPSQGRRISLSVKVSARDQSRMGNRRAQIWGFLFWYTQGFSSNSLFLHWENESKSPVSISLALQPASPLGSPVTALGVSIPSYKTRSLKARTTVQNQDKLPLSFGSMRAGRQPGATLHHQHRELKSHC